MENKKELSTEQRLELISILKTRFEKNMNRHIGLDWANIYTKLEENNDKLWSLSEMERTGGEPDVIAYDSETNKFIFCDCIFSKIQFLFFSIYRVMSATRRP